MTGCPFQNLLNTKQTVSCACILTMHIEHTNIWWAQQQLMHGALLCDSYQLALVGSMQTKGKCRGNQLWSRWVCFTKSEALSPSHTPTCRRAMLRMACLKTQIMVTGYNKGTMYLHAITHVVLQLWSRLAHPHNTPQQQVTPTHMSAMCTRADLTVDLHKRMITIASSKRGRAISFLAWLC